ncbi:uncharacterized protein LOC122033806 [Zingiber officinale]|uniref:uncharacterized protein LOC122033806 n=1 Tax=Zingiber officinale TaxID=94328 RepID=UPI001C4C05E4|nr:uncharacterized protein LOC122033806 [Zingiber officinale]
MVATAVFRRCLQLIVFAAAAACSLANSNFINKTCEVAYSQDFCFSMLISDRRSINASTAPELAYIALDIDATADISSTVGVLQQIADKNQGTDLEAALNQCIMIYNNAGGDLEDARDAVGSKEYSNADALIDSAATSPDGCQNMFDDVEMPAPVAEKGEWLGERIDVCSALVKALFNQ